MAHHNVACQQAGLLYCICKATEQHVDGCAYLRSLRCPVGIECEHGHEVCSICDACNCETVIAGMKAIHPSVVVPTAAQVAEMKTEP